VIVVGLKHPRHAASKDADSAAADAEALTD
jgi:hypothetical protein